MGSWTGASPQAAHARTKEQLMVNDKVIHPHFRCVYYIFSVISVFCTYLYKIKARQERDAVLGGFLLGFALGGHHLGVGPVAACSESKLVRDTGPHRYFHGWSRPPLHDDDFCIWGSLAACPAQAFEGVALVSSHRPGIVHASSQQQTEAGAEGLTGKC